MLKNFTSFCYQYRIQLLIILVSVPYLAAQTLHGGDFEILLKGAGVLRNGISPYGVVLHLHNDVTDSLLYSPFVAFILIPLTYLPEFIPTFLFNLISLLLLFRIWNIIVYWLNIDALSASKKKWWYIISIAFIIRFVMHNFENSQMNIVVLYLSLEGLYQIFLRGKAFGGFLLAVGICLKILPVIFLPYLVYKGKISATLGAVVFCVMLLLSPATWFGLPFDLQLLQNWWAVINPTLDKYNAGQNTNVQFHCISALIPVYFSDSSYKGLSVNIMSLAPAQIFLLINIIRLLLVSLTFYFLWIGRRAKEQRERSQVYLFWELAYIFMLIPLIFPQQAKYSYVNLLPAIAYIAYYLVNIYDVQLPKVKRDRTVLLLTLIVVGILTIFTADIFWGMTFGKYFQFLKLITIGALLLIPVLAFFSPKRLLSDVWPT